MGHILGDFLRSSSGHPVRKTADTTQRRRYVKNSDRTLFINRRRRDKNKNFLTQVILVGLASVRGKVRLRCTSCIDKKVLRSYFHHFDSH
jgi:hypothetical protein